MAFPPEGYTLGETDAEAHAARSTWANVAHAVAEFAPVVMVVDPADTAIAADYLDERIEIRTAELNDAWMRDIGPTFVTNDAGELAAVDWVFNGWGAQDWASWDKDSKIGAQVAEWAGVERIDSTLVNEGGGIHVDGEGTVLATETVQLDAGRNPGITKEEVEVEFARTLGATKVHWLPRGLTRDSEEFGTRGHVDIVATIPSPGNVLVHTQHNPEHPDHAVSREIIASPTGPPTPPAARSTSSRSPPRPTLRDEEGFVDYSYINHLVVNGGVVACTFNDPTTKRPCRPGRRLPGTQGRRRRRPRALRPRRRHPLHHPAGTVVSKARRVMSQSTLKQASRNTQDAPPPASGLVRGKGLASGQLGLFAAVMIGISTIAPAYVLTSSLGPTVQAIGTQLPAIFIIGFIPMFLVALAYRELNADTPDSGTTFTWVSQAFGPALGWLGGWGLLAANIIVLSNLAGVAVDFFYLFLAQATGQPRTGRPVRQQRNQHPHLPGLRRSGRLHRLPRADHHALVQYVLVGFQLAGARLVCHQRLLQGRRPAGAPCL